MAIGVIRREAAIVGHRREVLGGSLADTVLLVPPTVRGAAVAAGLASLIVVEFLPVLHRQSSPAEIGAWLVAIGVGALVYVYLLKLARHLLRHEPYGTTYSTRLAAKLYAGYAVAAVACSATQTFVHAVVSTAFDGDDVAGGVARAAAYFILGPTVNALLELRHRVREQERVLRERLRELERARAMLARADELVRREAAEVLHGRVQSRLLAAQVRLERLAGHVDDWSRDEITGTVALLDDLRVNEVRATSHRLHPPAIRVGLLAAVRSLVATFEGSFQVEVDLQLAPGVLELDDPMSAHTADEDTRLVVYRAIEEALANAYRHGRATRVSVELVLLPGDRLQLRVADDGVGFATTDFSVGLGVASVAARVEGRGGAWWINSTPGEGTVFNAVVPIGAKPAATPGNSG